MSLPYIAPWLMAEYKQQVLLFAKGAPSLECVRSHYIPEKNGVCDLTGQKEQEDLFVLANRAGSTLKVSAQSMQIIANIVEIQGADQWYLSLKEQRKALRDRAKAEAKQIAENRKNAPSIVVRRRQPSVVLKDNSTH